MQEKPAYRVLKHLIREQWHTHTRVRAVDGRVKFRGFYGTYDIRVFADGKEIPVTYTLSSLKTNALTIRL